MGISEAMKEMTLMFIVLCSATSRHFMYPISYVTPTQQGINKQKHFLPPKQPNKNILVLHLQS